MPGFNVVAAHVFVYTKCHQKHLILKKDLATGQHGGPVVSVPALQKDGPGFDSLSRGLSVLSLHVLYVTL